MFCTPSTAKALMENVILARLVPFIQSSPGLGKSSIVKELAEDYNLQLIDVRLAQVDPTELNGFPVINGAKAAYKPMEIFPIDTDPLPKGKDGWLLFLDELSSCPPAVQAAAYKLILDRMVGQTKLHDKVVVVAAGNLTTDNAIVTPISTALQSRVIHMHMQADLNDFKTWAYANGISSNVISFLNWKPELLHKFDPDHDDCTFPCPRTWEFASRIEKTFKGQIPRESAVLFQGTLGKGAGLEFYSFTQIQNDLVSYDEIVANPNSCKLPSEPSTQWSLIGMLVSQVTAKDLNQVMQFIERLNIEFQVIFIKDLSIKDKSLIRTNSKIQNWISTNATRFA